MFFQWLWPILPRAGGQGRAGCPTHSGKYSVPISKRVIAHFSMTGQRSFVHGHARRLYNGTQAVVEIGGPRPCAHLPKDDKMPGPKRGPGPLSKSDVTHLQPRFEICPKRVGQTCISPSVTCRTATVCPIPSKTGYCPFQNGPFARLFYQIS
jgi:hypothetical protein